MSRTLIVADAELLDAVAALEEQAEVLRASLLRLSAVVSKFYESGAIDGPGIRGRLEAKAKEIARIAKALPSATSQLTPAAAAFVSDVSRLDDLP